MRLNPDLWSLVCLIVRSASGMPQWLVNVTYLSLEEVENLPMLDHAADGQVARPTCDIFTVTADYLNFLVRQIEMDARGLDWTELFKARLNAIRPLEGGQVINMTFYRKPDSITFRIDKRTKNLLQIEII